MFFSWLRNAISPAYVTMFVAAFVLWYITKLGETYTTEHTVVVESLGTEFEVDCTIRARVLTSWATPSLVVARTLRCRMAS